MVSIEILVNIKRYFKANVTVPTPKKPKTVDAHDMQVTVPRNEEMILEPPLIVV